VDHDNDKLSLALHKLSQRLVTFVPIADVGPEVLWPLEHPQDDDQLWPRMRDYSIHPGAIAPSGQWSFQRSDSDSDDDWYDGAAPGDQKENPFRYKLDPDAAHRCSWPPRGANARCGHFR
jgi:hypothetical protein